MESFHTYICRTHHTADLLHRIQVGAQTTVHGEDLLVDDCSNGQAIEAIRECFPQLDIVSPLALVVEAINSVDGCAFVIATENEKVLGVFDLVCEQKADCLKGLLASIDVISEEEVISFRRETAVFKKTQ